MHVSTVCLLSLLINHKDTTVCPEESYFHIHISYIPGGKSYEIFKCNAF